MYQHIAKRTIALCLLCLGVVPSCDGVELATNPDVAVVTSEITVRPPISVGTGLDGADTYINSAAATTNYGSATTLRMLTPMGSSEVLLRFDPATIRGLVGSDYFLSATMRVYTPASFGKFTAYSVAPSAAAWTEGGATWNCAVQSGGSCGAAWSGSRLGTYFGESADQTGVARWHEWNVTSEVAAILAGTGSHPGFIIQGSSLLATTDFVSSEDTLNPTLHPQLVITVVANNYDYVPANPTNVPALDRSAPTHVYDAMSWLLDPARGLQFGISPTVINPNRAAVIRGRVFDRNGGALPGVEITVLGHPEYGATRSRALDPEGNSTFEMMVNGGETLTLNYRRLPTASNGYISAQRQVVVPWNGWVPAPDVVLTPRTAIGCASVNTTTGGFAVIPHTCGSYGSSASCNAVVGCRWNGTACTPGDARGPNRTMSMYVPAGTQVRYGSGTGTEETSVHLCLGEATIDPAQSIDSVAGMPADLPATTSYTFAAEGEVRLTATGAPVSNPEFETSADIDTDFFLYVRSDGFLNFPAGTVVPNGSYDEERGGWTAERNGVVIGVDRTSGCVVSPDLTALPSLTTAERTAICSNTTAFPTGRYLRAPTRHFSLADLNWLVNQIARYAQALLRGSSGVSCPVTIPHSVVYCENQALGEMFSVTDTPYSLVYVSDRHEGRRENYRVSVTPVSAGVTADPVPAGVSLELWVAGRRAASMDVPSTSGTSYDLVWDGQDAYGRELVGPQRAYVRVGYRYTGQNYLDVSLGDPPVAGESTFAMVPPDAAVELGDSQEFTAWFTYPVTMGSIDDLDSGLGGLGIDEHHFYDPATGTLFMGDGTRRTAENVGNLVDPGYTTATAFGSSGVAGGLKALAVGPDGTVYWVDGTRLSIRRPTDSSPILLGPASMTFDEVRGLSVGRWVDAAGAISTVLWAVDRGGSGGPTGNCLYRISLPSDPATASRTAVLGLCGAPGIEGTPVAIGSPRDVTTASAVRLAAPTDVAAAPDGSVYVADSDNRRVLRFRSQSTGPGTLRNTVELVMDQTSNPELTGTLAQPTTIAVGPDGGLYYNVEGTIRELLPAGDDVAVAGASGSTPNASNLADGAVALCLSPTDTTCAYLGDAVESITSIDVSSEGRVCFGLAGAGSGTALTRNRVRCLRDGRIYTMAGTRWVGDTNSFNATLAVNVMWDSTSAATPATRTLIGQVGDVVTSPDGRIFFADLNSATGGLIGRVRFVAPTLDGSLVDNHVIASADGSVYYEFNGAGRHLRTVDAITNVNLHVFTYDGTPGPTLGRLEGIHDPENGFTDIIWDTSPARIRLRSPGGATTTIALSGIGQYATSIADPFPYTWTLGFGAPSTNPGLLTSMTDARGGAHVFTYDLSTGRLTRDATAADTGAGTGAELDLVPSNGTCNNDGFCEVGETNGDCAADCPTNAPSGYTTVSLVESAEAGLALSGRTTAYRSRGVGTPFLERATSRGPTNFASILRRNAAADGRATRTTLLHNTVGGSEVNAVEMGSVTTFSAPDPRPTFAMDAAYPARVLLDRPVGPDTVITTTRTYAGAAPAGTLTTAVTMPSPTGSGDVTYTRRVSGSLVQFDPPSVDTNRDTSMVRDARGRVTRVNLPGMYPVCITYPSATAIRPSAIYQAPLTGDLCSMPTSPRREVTFGYDDTDGTAPFHRWALSRTDGPSGGLTTTMTRDARGALDRVYFPGTGLSYSDPNFDGHGNLTSMNAPAGLAHTFTYTGRDRLLTYTPPSSGADITGSTYYLNGGMNTRSYAGPRYEAVALSATTGFVSVVSRTDVASNDLSFTRDPSGRPLTLSNYSGSLALTWDGPLVTSELSTGVSGTVGVSGRYTRGIPAHLRLSSERVCFGSSATCTTSAGGRLINRTYDVDGLLTGAGDSAGATVGTTGYTYAFSATTGTTMTGTADFPGGPANKVTTITSMTPFGELSSTSISRAAGTLYQEQICSRDPLGRVLTRGEIIRDGTTGSTTSLIQHRYTYDGHGFLASYEMFTYASGAICTGFAVANRRINQTWSYDNEGNRNDLTTNDEDQVTTGTRSYDALGALSFRGTESFLHDLTGHLRTWTSGANNVAYGYDGAGRLIRIQPSAPSATNPAEEFLYRDGLNPVGWRRTSASSACSTGMDTFYFVYGTSEHTPEMAILDECSDGSLQMTYRLISDERGSVRLVVATYAGTVAGVAVAAGEVVQRIDYNAWGMPLTAAPAPIANPSTNYTLGLQRFQPFGFAGGIWLRGPQLWHFGARDYDPTIGRWTSRDPILHAGGYNLYVYAGNDPVGQVDPNGRHPVVAGIIFGVIIGGAVEAFMQSQSCEGLNPGNIAIAAFFGGVAGGLGGLLVLLEVPGWVGLLGNAAAGMLAGGGTQASQNYAGGRPLSNGLASALLAGAAGGAGGFVAGRAASAGAGRLGRALWGGPSSPRLSGLANHLGEYGEVYGDVLGEGIGNGIEGMCSGVDC